MPLFLSHEWPAEVGVRKGRLALLATSKADRFVASQSGASEAQRGRYGGADGTALAGFAPSPSRKYNRGMSVSSPGSDDVPARFP